MSESTPVTDFPYDLEASFKTYDKDDRTGVARLALKITELSFEGIISPIESQEVRRAYLEELNRLCSEDPSSIAAATLTADSDTPSNDPSRSLTTTFPESQSHPSTTSSPSTAYRTSYPLAAYNFASARCPLTDPPNLSVGMSGLHRSIFDHVQKKINDAFEEQNRYPRKMNTNPQCRLLRIVSRIVDFEKDANTEFLPRVEVCIDEDLHMTTSLAFYGNDAFDTALRMRVLLRNTSLQKETESRLSESLSNAFTKFLSEDPTLHESKFSAYVPSLKESETAIRDFYKERLTSTLKHLIENGDNTERHKPISVSNLHLFGPNISMTDDGKLELIMSIKAVKWENRQSWTITDDWKYTLPSTRTQEDV